jgi:hypothetical protein
MKKTLIFAVVFAISLSICPPAFSGSPSLSSPGRPMVTIEGTLHAELTTDMISVSMDSRTKKLVITLANLSGSPPGYTYSDGTLLIPGVHIALHFGSHNSMTTVFDGTITTLAPEFPDFSPPVLTITATGKPLPSKQNTISIAYGADLSSFSPVLSGRGPITCSGTTPGNPDIQTGTKLDVNGTGQRFSQTYTVTGTVHAFDLQKGYTTKFTGTTVAQKIYSGIDNGSPAGNDIR